jgi:DNA-binding IclR family transcriptional regulator
MSPNGPYVRRLRPARPSVGSTEKGMMLLACFSPESRALTAEQIADRLGLLPATVEILAENLVKLHCLDIDPFGAYTLATSSHNNWRL